MYIERCKHGSGRGWNKPTIKISQGDCFLLYNAYKAVNLGFADGILFSEDKQKPENTEEFIFSRESAISAVMNRVKKRIKNTEQESKIPAEPLYKRLNLLCKQKETIL